MLIRGILHAFFETGTEGVYWATLEDGKQGYDALRFLEEGDKLTIFRKSGSVLWSGKIAENTWGNWYPYGWVTRPHTTTIFCGKSRGCSKGHSVSWARRNHLGQQISCGMWVHWLQKRFKPDNWGRMFLKELRCEVETGS